MTNYSPILKQRIGQAMIPRLPVSRHVFDHIRLELNAARVRLGNRFLPSHRRVIRRLKQRRELLVNIGCGPFGRPDGWVNMDLNPLPNLTLRADCRRRIPLADASARGIHVEHFYEHMSPFDERPQFLAECHRVLEPGGVLRIIVPDAELYVKAYAAEGWTMFNDIGCGGESPEEAFETKMQALNHVFLQGAEHFGGLDEETLMLELRQVGFTSLRRCHWREGEVSICCIDRDQHKPYSLYVEAVK